MPEARSINQNTAAKPLPDFRNQGTMLRVVLLVNGFALLAMLLQAASLHELMNGALSGSAQLQPSLLAGLLLLYAFNPLLARLRHYWHGAVAVAAVCAAATISIDLLAGAIIAGHDDDALFRYLRHALVAILLSQILLAYFRLRAQALSPARHEARLQALQSRIRPHFLFNTINAVLGIVRADPKRAETALEDMADLFRMAMAEPHELAPLSKEIELARQYLAIEELRIGERLKVSWDMQTMPPEVMIPPLMLQPLLENAVYHGIEPLPEGGLIEIRLYREGDELHLEVRNPCREGAVARSGGNKMALSNIRERLALLFDVEGQYQVGRENGHYHVHIRIPCVQGERT